MTPIKKVERKLKEWEKIFANHLSDKDLVFRIYKNSYNSTTKKTNNLIKKWTKYLTRQFST